jgi:quinol monooxygenase YgiN
MATMLAHIHVNPGMESAFEAVAAELWRGTHAGETGVARYEYWRGAEQGAYYMLGSFDGYDGFIRHQVSEHHVSAGSKLKPMIAEMRIEWIDPVDQANGLPATQDSSPGAGADASELERSYRSRFPVAIQGWWRPLRRVTAD